MQFDEFVKLVRRRRSVRKFKPDPIPEEYIKEVLEAARWAMSGANGQPWEFIVVKDQATKDKMAEQYEEEILEPELKPEYVEKIKKIQKRGKFKKFTSVKELRAEIENA